MKEYTIESKKTISSWDEGLPLGNGDMGAIIWSKSDQLRFSIDKGDIWDCSYRPEEQEDFTYHKMTEFIRKNKQSHIRKIFDKNGYARSTPTKLPVGKILLNLKAQENVVSRLDISSAQATLQAGSVCVQSFISARERIGYIRTNCSETEVQLENPEFGKEHPPFLQKWFKNKGISYALKSLHYPAPVIKRECIQEQGTPVELFYYIQQVSGSFSYSMVAAVSRKDSQCLAAYTVVSSNDGDGFLNFGRGLVLRAVLQGYEEAFERHKTWWAQYWGKSKITIPDKALEKNWYVGNYLLASCSRKGFYPMPLQGLWTADEDRLPPWKGDYHHDLNTQLSYLSYGKANHMEEGECFIDYLIGLAPRARAFANSFYGTQGLCLPAVMDIRGDALGGWAMYALSPTNQLWLCDMIFRHYEYGMDSDFLEEKAYPYAEQSMRNILELLEEREGKLYLPWSSSPEIHDDTRKSFLLPNTNYDLSLILSVLKKLIFYAPAAHKEEKAEQYRAVLHKLDPLAVDWDDVLMLSRNERLTQSHRHHSHAMAIYPLRLLNADLEEDKKIIDATIGDLEKLGTKNWCGYSFAWMAQMYCVQRNGAKAARMLEIFWKYFCLGNGFHVNGDYTRQGFSDLTYRPFTLEGTFCAVSALQEMLLFSEEGVLEPLRAVPETWRDMEFENLRCSGGLLVSLKYEKGAMAYLRIQAARDAAFSLIHKFHGSFQTSKPVLREEGKIVVSLKKDEVLIVEKAKRKG